MKLKVNESFTNPKKTNPNELVNTVLGWYDFDTNYIDDGGQRRTAEKKNQNTLEWFNEHPLELKQKAYKIMLSKVHSSEKAKVQNTFGKLISEVSATPNTNELKMKNIKETIKSIVKEESEYEVFFRKALDKAGKKITDMNDDEKKAFFTKIDNAWTGKGEKNEGNAFGAERAKAIAKGDDSFEVDGKPFKVTGVDAEDKENAEKFSNESIVNEQSDPLELKGIKINKKSPITFVLEVSFVINGDVVVSYLTTGTQQDAQKLKSKLEKAFSAGKIVSPSGIGYYAYNESVINEEKYTVIDPKGNQMGASDKGQAVAIAKKKGGEKEGYFVVSNKNALKARRALEKFKGDFKNPKLRDMMADLFYESVEEASTSSAPGEWVAYLSMARGKKLLKTFDTARGAKMFLSKNVDKLLGGANVESVGIMTKKQWDEREAKYAIEGVNEGARIVLVNPNTNKFVKTVIYSGPNRDADKEVEKLNSKLPNSQKEKGFYWKVSSFESVNEGKKRFKQQDGVGSSKYTISYHDGKKKHTDGSDFFDIKIFKNKPELEAFKKDLVSKGFVSELVNETKFEPNFAKKIETLIKKELGVSELQAIGPRTGRVMNRQDYYFHIPNHTHGIVVSKKWFGPSFPDEYYVALTNRLGQSQQETEVNHIKDENVVLKTVSAIAKKYKKQLTYAAMGETKLVNEAFNVKDLPNWLFDDPIDFEDWYEGGMELANGKGKLAPFSSSDEKKLFQLVGMWQDAEGDYQFGRGDYGTGKTTGARSVSYSAQDLIKKFLTQKGKVVKTEGNTFGAERAKAIAKGDDSFEVDGKPFKVTGVDAKDKENAKKFSNENTELPKATIPAAVQAKLDMAIDKIKDTKLSYNQKLSLIGKVMDGLGVDKGEFNKMASKLKGTMEGKSVNEGNAFGMAVNAAKKEGLKEFEFNGKMYKVKTGSYEKNEAAKKPVVLSGFTLVPEKKK